MFYAIEVRAVAARILADAGSTVNIKTAIIGAVALVLAAAIPAILSTREREPHATKELRLMSRQQRSDFVKLQTDYANALDEIDRLERLCFLNGIDPQTGVKISSEQTHE